MDVVSTVQVFNSLMASGMKVVFFFSPDAAVTPVVMGVFDNPVGFLPEPLGVEVLHGWQLSPGDVLCSFHHPL